MRRLRPNLALAGLLIISATSVAVANPFNLPEKTHKTLQQTMFHLFNEEFSETDKHLRQLAKTQQGHPVVELATVLRNWWKMTLDLSENDEAKSADFLESAQACLDSSRKAIGTKSEAEAYFALGTIQGLMSRYAVANRAWIAAYMRGQKAVDYSTKALEKNPALVDAYMTLGTFNYARDLIRGSVEREGIDTDKEKSNADGLSDLRKVYEQGTYFQEASGLLLAGILMNDKPSEALPLLSELKERLPKSAFVRMLSITSLYNTGDLEKMAAETQDFLEKINDNTFPQHYLPQAYFAQGLLSFRNKEWNSAIENFEKASASGEESNPYFTWAYLYKGYCYDAIQDREKAKEAYMQVLLLRRRFASHDHARQRLQKPFRDTDVEMTKVEL